MKRMLKTQQDATGAAFIPEMPAMLDELRDACITCIVVNNELKARYEHDGEVEKARHVQSRLDADWKLVAQIDRVVPPSPDSWRPWS